MNTKILNIKLLRLDGGTQTREAMDDEAIQDYADALDAGMKFPPVDVFFDGKEYWLADGFHRVRAHLAINRASILIEYHVGGREDAMLFAAGSNLSHGLRRNNADKRNAVLMVLSTRAGATWSSRKIAETVGVGHKFVDDCKNPERAEVRKADKRKPDDSKVRVFDAPAPAETPAEVASDATPSPETPDKKAAKTTPGVASDATLRTEIDEYAEKNAVLSEENDRLNDRLAVEAMDASEEEKAAAAETIANLRQTVTALTAELAAVKASRDSYQRENASLKTQIKMMTKAAAKAK